MSSPNIPANPNPADIGGLIPTASGLYVPPSGANPLAHNPNTQALGGDIVTDAEAEAAQLAILTLMRIVRSRAEQRAAEASLVGTQDAVSSGPIAPDIDTGLPNGYTLVRHSTNDGREHHGELDPRNNALDIPVTASREEAVAIDATNTATSLQLGPKFGMEYNAINQAGVYRTLSKRIHPETGEPVFVDEGQAIMELTKTAAGLQPKTRKDRENIEHVQHASAEAMILKGKASIIESVLAPVINARNMLSRRNAKFIVEPSKLDEVIVAKIYDASGKYVGPSTDPQELEKRFSLVELAEKNTRLAGKVRVFDKDGKYVGQTTDPEIAKTLYGYEDLGLPVRTRQYLTTDLTRHEKKVTKNQLQQYLEFTSEANRYQRESRHLVEHTHEHAHVVHERELPSLLEARREAKNANKALFSTAVPVVIDYYRNIMVPGISQEAIDELAKINIAVPLLSKAISAGAEVKRVREVRNLNNSWQEARQALIDSGIKGYEGKVLKKATQAVDENDIAKLITLEYDDYLSQELKAALRLSRSFLETRQTARRTQAPN